jgi:hypothetical protein
MVCVSMASASFLLVSCSEESIDLVDDANTIYLKLFRDFGSTVVVKEHLVPILIQDLDGIVNNEWDLALQQIVPYINGVSHIKHIALMSGVEIEIVKQVSVMNFLNKIVYSTFGVR